MTLLETHRHNRAAMERMVLYGDDREPERMADHKWVPGAYGICRRCGTDPRIAFDKEHHPK